MKFSISFGKELKINDEIVPEYLQQALLGYLEQKQKVIKVDCLVQENIQASHIQTSGLKVSPSNLTLG